MTHATCRLTAKNRDQLRNPTVGNRVRTTFTFFELLVCNFLVDFCPSLAHCALFNERKVGVQLPASAVNVTLLALPLLRRRPCSNRSISRADSSNTPPPQRRSEGTDRQTRLRKKFHLSYFASPPEYRRKPQATTRDNRGRLCSNWA